MEENVKIKLENLKRIEASINKVLEIQKRHSKTYGPVTKDDLLEALEDDITIDIDNVRSLDYSIVLDSLVFILRNKWSEIDMIDNPYPYFQQNGNCYQLKS